MENEHRELQRRLKVTDMHALLCYNRTCHSNSIYCVKAGVKILILLMFFSNQLFERELKDNKNFTQIENANFFHVIYLLTLKPTLGLKLLGHLIHIVACSTHLEPNGA